MIRDVDAGDMANVGLKVRLIEQLMMEEQRNAASTCAKVQDIDRAHWRIDLP